MSQQVLTNNNKQKQRTLGKKENQISRVATLLLACDSVQSVTLRPHGLQHARPPCLWPTPRVYSNSCPLSWWCHPTISSSVVPFSSYPQSFPASGPFQMSQFFASGGQSTGVSASASVLPMNMQDWLPLGWTGWYVTNCFFLATFKIQMSKSTKDHKVHKETETMASSKQKNKSTETVCKKKR